MDEDEVRMAQDRLHEPEQLEIAIHLRERNAILLRSSTSYYTSYDASHIAAMTGVAATARLFPRWLETLRQLLAADAEAEFNDSFRQPSTDQCLIAGEELALLLDAHDREETP